MARQTFCTTHKFSGSLLAKIVKTSYVFFFFSLKWWCHSLGPWEENSATQPAGRLGVQASGFHKSRRKGEKEAGLSTGRSWAALQAEDPSAGIVLLSCPELGSDSQIFMFLCGSFPWMGVAPGNLWSATSTPYSRSHCPTSGEDANGWWITVST